MRRPLWLAVLVTVSVLVAASTIPRLLATRSVPHPAAAATASPRVARPAAVTAITTPTLETLRTASQRLMEDAGVALASAGVSLAAATQRPREALAAWRPSSFDASAAPLAAALSVGLVMGLLGAWLVAGLSRRSVTGRARHAVTLTLRGAATARAARRAGLSQDAVRTVLHLGGRPARRS